MVLRVKNCVKKDSGPTSRPVPTIREASSTSGGEPTGNILVTWSSEAETAGRVGPPAGEQSGAAACGDLSVDVSAGVSSTKLGRPGNVLKPSGPQLRMRMN
jgi:hypothetical protein